MSEEVCTCCTPPELRETNDLLPKKSRSVYEKGFKSFQVWCETNNVEVITEKIMLSYFGMLSTEKKASTLWATYSMLKSCLNIYRNVDISNYNELLAYLKILSKGYKAKKSKVLEAEDIDRFIINADDKMYLAIKVVLILGYCGACRRDEITNMSIDDVEFKTDVIMVSVPKTRNNVSRLFAITEELWIDVIKKYVNLRPTKIAHKRLLLTYRGGYCINCPIGINTIGKMPRIIADYLKLPNPEHYTGHCFRRSSTTHLANRGGNLVTIKRHGVGKPSTISEGYIETSVKRNVEMTQMFSPQPSTSNSYGESSALQLYHYDTKPVIPVCNETIVGHNFVSA